MRTHAPFKSACGLESHFKLFRVQARKQRASCFTQHYGLQGSLAASCYQRMRRARLPDGHLPFSASPISSFQHLYASCSDPSASQHKGCIIISSQTAIFSSLQAYLRSRTQVKPNRAVIWFDLTSVCVFMCVCVGGFTLPEGTLGGGNRSHVECRACTV